MLSTESRMRGDMQVRFGGRYGKTYCRKAVRRSVPSLRIGQGGDIITLAMELQKTRDISYALKAIEGHFPAAFRPAASVRKPEPQTAGYRQVRVDPLTNPVLLNYLKERGILPEIARKTCKEVHFENKGKWYFAVAFANRSGGYEIRNKYLKGSISPKEITHIKNGGDHCIVVEGFMDYLSYLTLKSMRPASGQPVDYIVLNSVSNVGKAIPILKEYKSAFCLLDNDPAGKQAFCQMAEAGCPVKDKSACYVEYNDLNDYLLGKKMISENRQRHAGNTSTKERSQTKQYG